MILKHIQHCKENASSLPDTLIQEIIQFVQTKPHNNFPQIYSTDQRQGIMRLRFKRGATAFIASIDAVAPRLNRGSASFEPRLRLV